MAFEDYLTGLPSRARLHELLHHALELARRDGKCGAVLLIDLDHFKTINDALGHDVGDEVLRALGQRLQDALGQYAVVARVGGDEFVALIDLASRDLLETERFAQMLAQQVMDKLQSPVLIGERAIIIGASIGGAAFPENGETVLDVLRHAEMALYLAKDQGRANTRFYPLDEMKIDKSFVQELDQATEHPLIESMIAIGRHMGLSVIAEGVETKAQRDILLQLGCRHFQGYLFSRPLPEDVFVQWLKNHASIFEVDN
jgi:diguanylate cyclase (GGDEF)-like protein